MGMGKQYSDPRKSERWVGTVDVDVEAVPGLSCYHPRQPLSGSHLPDRDPLLPRGE